MNTRAIIAFVPVIHKGYIDFFNKNNGDIYVIGDELIREFVHLGRDLRLIPPKNMLILLRVIFPRRKIHILNDKALKNFPYRQVTMPEDEISYRISEKLSKNVKTKYASVFLRWNRLISFKETEVRPDIVITRKKADKMMLSKALLEADKSSDWWRQIGAVLVKDGQIILKSHNHHLPTDHHLSVNGDPRSNFDAGQHPEIYTSIHAEAEIIAQAARRGISLNGAELYSTTFPCPNCARLIARAGIKRVYYMKGYSVLDAEKIFKYFGIQVIMVK